MKNIVSVSKSILRIAKKTFFIIANNFDLIRDQIHGIIDKLLIDEIISDNSKYLELATFQTKKTYSGNIRLNHKDKIQRLFIDSKNHDIDLISIIEKCSNSKTAFIDIGANIGFYSRYYSEVANSQFVYSFEPNPEVFRYLKYNVPGDQNNKFNIGLSDSPGELNLYYDENQTGRASLERNNLHENVVVKVDRLDSVLPISKIKAEKYIIKIDVEEHEISVINGMHNWLEDMRPKLFYIELRMHTYSEIHNILSKYGYAYYGEKIDTAEYIREEDIGEMLMTKKYINGIFTNDIKSFVGI